MKYEPVKGTRFINLIEGGWDNAIFNGATPDKRNRDSFEQNVFDTLNLLVKKYKFHIDKEINNSGMFINAIIHSHIPEYDEYKKYKVDLEHLAIDTIDFLATYMSAKKFYKITN